jgi:hypothetical protein
MDDHELVIVKYQKQTILPLLGALIWVPLIAIYFYYKADWVRFGFIAFLWSMCFAYAIRCLYYKIIGKSIYNDITLKLTPMGFYVGDKLYKWSDIDHFGIKKEFITLIGSLFGNDLVIYWNYIPNYNIKRRNFLSKYDDALSFSTGYEMEPLKLVNLLNDWKTKYSGQTSEIKIGNGVKTDNQPFNYTCFKDTIKKKNDGDNTANR